MEEVKVYMDKDRRLFLKDKSDKKYSVDVLGYGVPAAFVIETSEERKEKDKKLKEWKKQRVELEQEKISSSTKMLVEEVFPAWY